MINPHQHHAVYAKRREQALRHPIGRAIALNEFESVRRTLQLKVMYLEHGQPCRKLLAEAAWVVGIGAELSRKVQHADARRIHATLRGVMQAAQEGALWKDHLALPLDQAVATSHTLLRAFPDLALQYMPGAEYLRERILTHSVDGTEVAGAEIYSTSPATAPTEAP